MPRSTPDAPCSRPPLFTLALEGVAPLAVFWVVRHSAGPVAGMTAATGVSVILVVFSRRQGRRGWLPLLTLSFLAVQLTVGLVARSERVYFSQAIAVSAVFALAFAVSALTPRPLAGVFAAEMYRLDVAVWRQPGYLRTFRFLSLVWAGYYLVYAALQGAALSASVGAFSLVSTLFGLPVVVLLLAWSVPFATRRLDDDPALASADATEP